MQSSYSGIGRIISVVSLAAGLIACGANASVADVVEEDQAAEPFLTAHARAIESSSRFPIPTPGDFASASFAEAADFITSQCNVRREGNGGLAVWSTRDFSIASDGSVRLTSTTPGRRNVPVSFHVKDVYVYDLSDSVTLEVRTEVFGNDKIGPRLIAMGDRRVDIATIYCTEWKRVSQAFARLRELKS